MYGLLYMNTFLMHLVFYLRHPGFLKLTTGYFPYVDAFGDPSGCDYLIIIGEICRTEGWKAEYIKGTWNQGLERVKKGQMVAKVGNPEFIEFQREYLEALANKDYLEADFERQQTLNNEKVTILYRWDI